MRLMGGFVRGREIAMRMAIARGCRSFGCVVGLVGFVGGGCCVG